MTMLQKIKQFIKNEYKESGWFAFLAVGMAIIAFTLALIDAVKPLFNQ